MKEQEPENKAENDNRMPEANCACTLETCGEKRIKQEICMDILAKKKLLARDEGISPTRLSEMINKEINDSLKRINNSIKDAMKTLVKSSMEEKQLILPCSKEPKGISNTSRSHALEERCKESLNVCTNRQTTCHVSRQRDKLSTHDSSYLCKKMHENAIPLPVQNKVNGERKSKKHSKSANNVNTDNRRMTGNVNIYICSETNDNNQGRKKSRSPYMDTSSNTITEFNSGSASASSASSCKLINSIKEKQKKLLAQQLPNFSHEKSDDNVVCDNGTLQHRISRKELSESNSKEEAVKVNDENIRCKDAISSTKDYYCKDTNNIDLEQDSSYLTVPCSSFSACNNTKHPESWMTTYPSESKARLDDNNVFLSRAICTDMEQKNYRKNNDCNNNVHGNDSECTMCHAVDSSRWLPKSIYTECVFGEEPREYFADGCKYRNKIFQDSSINRNDIRKKQTGRLQQSFESCQREIMARRWSTCSCIAEEDEDYCKNVDKKELPQNVCNAAESLEKISICQTPRKLVKSVTVCETSSGDGKRFEKSRTCKKKEQYLKDTSVCETRFGNSVEPPKVTRVCQEFVTEEHPEDITVCKTAFGEPNRLPEEAIVYTTEHSDSKDTPKETICKEILDSNFANQDDVNRVFLNDVKDKLVEESTTSSNLNSPEENAGNKRMVKPNNKHDVALNSFTGQQSTNVEQDKRINKMMNDGSKYVPRTPIESIKDSKPLSKNVYSTLPRAQFYNRSNLVSNSSVKKTSKSHINQRRMQSLNRSMRNHFQQSNNPTQNLISNKNNQQKEKTLENSQEKEERQDISKEMKTVEDKQRESRLRLLKKLIDVIKRGKTFITDRIETGKIEAKETIANGERDVEQSEIASEIENKLNGIKNQQKIIKKVTISMKPLQTEITDKEKKMDIERTDQTMPKLLRVIAAKRSRVLPIVVTTDSKPQQFEVLSVPAKKITTHIDQKKLSEKKVTLQEHSPVEVTKEIKADIVITPEMNVAAVEDALKDVADENRVSQDILNDTTRTYVACPQKKPEGKLQKLILCKCGLPSDSNGCLCSIAKYMKDRVPCPQKKLEEEPQKSALCTRELLSNSNNYLYSIVKCTKCNNIIDNCPCKDNKFEQNKIYCPYCRLSTMQCICILNLKNCLKTDKPKFHDTSPSKISSQICTNYCIKKRKERKCRKTTTCCHSCEECKCRWCATRGDFSRIIDKCKCASQERCSNCDQLRNQCHCATLTLVKCHKNKKTGNRKRTMICLYCDNPRDKCTCRAPIGKCLYCGLPSDVCNCQGDKGHVWIAKRPNENRTICVTSWKPKREIRQYFERNYEDFEPYFTEEHQCCKKPKRQLPEELPYQRLNVFSEVINELQQKMCESVCCARCWRNPCCCGLPVDQDKRKEERKAENRLNYAKIERSSDSKSSNNYQYNRNSRNERKSTEKLIPIRHIGCVCKLTPCRYKKDRSNCKRPLAKCYYCKSLPCTIGAQMRPNEARICTYCCFLCCILCCSCITVK